jgi:hypothetical protein
MWKNTLLSTLAVFISWSILDYIIHGVILQASYEASAKLWRPMAEMKLTLMYITVLIVAFTFVSIYIRLISKKNLGTGLKYGLWFGFGVGISMGYGSYSVMPIPYIMALTWFLGSLVEGAVGGFIVGAIVKE